MPASTYVGNQILNFYLRGVDIAPAAGVWVSLHTADPGLAGASEVTNGGGGAWPAYVRVDAAQGGAIASGWSASVAKSSQNLKDLLFPAHNGPANVTVTHVGFWDAPAGGNFLFPGVMLDQNNDPTTKTYAPSDEPVIHPNKILVLVN